jgi:hypothetical protein
MSDTMVSLHMSSGSWKAQVAPIFLRYIQDLHVIYQKGKLPKCTPGKLIIDIKDKIRVLQHAEVWASTPPLDIPTKALTIA